MATSTGNVVTVLVGPSCPSCESHDLRWAAPLGAVQWGQCRDCGTEYRWYEEPMCPGCRMPHDEQQTGNAYCEDCGPSDCAFCGSTVLRPELSENLACLVCERGEVA